MPKGSFALTNLCVALGLFATFSFCIAMPPSRGMPHARRDIAQPIQPTLAIVGKDTAVRISDQGVEEFGVTQPEIVPEQDEPQETPVFSVDPVNSIEADSGVPGDAPFDSATYVGTVPIEPGTTPPQ